MTARERGALTAWLAAVLVCLLIVGVVSSTLLRHTIQAAPLAVMLIVIRRRLTFAACASTPIFAIWLLVMLLIWLYLLGIATFFDGSFSPIEIALTVLIGGFSAAGIRDGIRARGPHRGGCIGAFVLGVVLQIAALWISFMPAFAHR